MQHRSSRALSFVLAALLAIVSACSTTVAPPEDVPLTDRFDDLSLPLDVREYEVATADRARGVFIKLSRLPDSVEHYTIASPPSIVIDIKGPTGSQTAEEVFPGGDELVSSLRITRLEGVLRVILDLDMASPPAYSVHMMADWIMVRFADQSGSLPGREVQRSG